MTRHYDGTNYWPIRAQSKRHKVNVVFWTWRKHRIVRTQAEGRRLVRVWKDWYRRQGWTVRGDIAYRGEERHAVGLRTIDIEKVKDIRVEGKL